MTNAGEPEVEVFKAAASPPSRREAGLGLVAAGLLAPAGALAQASPPTGNPPQSQSQPPAPPSGAAPPAAGAASGPQSETLKAGRDLAERMTAVVYLNGQGPFHFLVDTGANQSGVCAELAAQLKLPPGQPVLVHGIAAGYLCQTVNVGEIRVGSLRTSLTNAPIFTRADLGADGLIGLDVLHDHVVGLDFVKQQIEVSRRSYSMSQTQVAGPGNTSAVVQARQRFGQLTIIDAEAGRAKMTCFIDTGADQSVGNMALRNAVQAKMRPEDVINFNVVIRSVTGQSVNGVVALVPSARIGGINFTRFGLAFADLHTFDLWGLSNQPALLVGMDLLRLFARVSIDFSQREVTFETRPR